MKRKTPSRGGKPDKLMRDSLMLELSKDWPVADAAGRIKKMRGFRALARAWVKAGLAGDSHAIEKIADRIDGKVSQQITGTGKDGAIPIDIKNLSNAQIQQLLDRLLAGLPGTGGG